MLARSNAVTQESPLRRIARRVAVTLVSAALVVTLGGGFLHTKAGRPWMARLFGASCPMNGVTAAQLDVSRRAVVDAARGTELAPARPAFGFHLDETTTTDVMTWARKAGVICQADKPWLLKCADVPAAALGRAPSEGSVEELALGFSALGRLVNVTTLRRHLSPADGSRVMRAIAAAVVADLGGATGLPPDVATGSVSHEPLSSMRMSLKYSDYLAEVTAMNLPSSGVAVREHYLSARD